jgi:hypothetical protein
VPAFSAYQSSAQTIASTTATKILFQSEEFDTTSNYDTTNSRFTPTVAGYYQISVGFNPPSVSRGAEVQLLVYKNGAAIRGLMDTVATATVITVGSCLVYCNGSTDYIEAFIWLQTGGTTIPSQPYDYFQGILIAAA